MHLLRETCDVNMGTTINQTSSSSHHSFLPSGNHTLTERLIAIPKTSHHHIYCSLYGHYLRRWLQCLGTGNASSTCCVWAVVISSSPPSSAFVGFSRNACPPNNKFIFALRPALFATGSGFSPGNQARVTIIDGASLWTPFLRRTSRAWRLVWGGEWRAWWAVLQTDMYRYNNYNNN